MVPIPSILRTAGLHMKRRSLLALENNRGKACIAATSTSTSATELFRKQYYSTSSSLLTSSFPTTPDVCDDCIGTIKVIDPELGFSNYGGKTHFGGKAVTVKCHEDNSMVKHLAQNVDGTGKVIVVDGGGSKRRALLGDMVASDCISNNWEGLVIYGSIRDVEEVKALTKLGVQALGSHPIPTTKRQEGLIDVPVTFGGVTISPGDWIVCDNNGIVVNESDPREERAKKKK